MKETIICFLLLLFLEATPAFSQEFLMARVLEVNPEDLELTIISPAAPDTQITVRIAEENDLPRDGGQIFLPGCVAPGETIRLWGSREQAKDPLFIATDIRGCRNGGCSDPTGVRSRLRKMWKYKYKSPKACPERSECGNHGDGGYGNGGGSSSQ